MSCLSEPILTAIARLRALTQTSVQTTWHYCDRDLSIAQATQVDDWHTWVIAPLNAKHHIAWSKGHQIRWLCQTITVPPFLSSPPSPSSHPPLPPYLLHSLTLRLALTWWAESAEIFVNGQLVQTGDLFDCSTRIRLSPAVTPGDQFAISLRLVSPGHDDGALVRSACLYEVPTPEHPPEPGFIADELEVLHTYLQAFAPDQLELLSNTLSHLASSPSSPSSPSPPALSSLRDRLLPLSPLVKQRKISLLGHAHLDLAWLWTVEETWKAAERTFESVLSLQQDFPEMIFCHSTPVLYEWIEHNRPDLFQCIQQQVEAGCWEPVGGLWVEPELNIIGGEAIARHILYGQRYFREKFGSINRIAWLPDSFGFNWQLPQLLKQGGIDYLVTQKLRWNDTTQFPYELFQWQAPDGSQVLSLMSAPIGEGINPVKMATYACNWEQKTGIPHALWLPGVGDHGGGPTRDMLELAQRWARSPFFPQLEFTTALAYLEELSTVSSQQSEPRTPNPEPRTPNPEPRTPPSEPQPLNFPLPPLPPLPSPSLPTWNSELYLEFHRGCYTTHAEQKLYNRQSEDLLYQAELWSALATLSTGVEYPKTELEIAWKTVLFNQFHDILPGSSISEVFVDANQAWERVWQSCYEIIDTALVAIVQQIALPKPPHPNARAIVVFNPLNWTRSQVLELDLGWAQHADCNWQLYDLQGQNIPSQAHWFQRNQQNFCKLYFTAEHVPGVGYRCFWICPAEPEKLADALEDDSSSLLMSYGEPPVIPFGKGDGDSQGVATIDLEHYLPEQESFVLENDWLRVTVDPTTGDLSSVFDNVAQREVLAGAGNQLQMFQDSGQYWDAWNIDPDYASHPLPGAELVEISYEVQGAIATRIRVVRKLAQATFYQIYSLYSGSPVLHIDTTVADWQERHVLVKVAFRLNLEADVATYDIPCGAIERTTKPQSDREKAQWEVPALRWADLSDGEYGISLLSDCKHGYDAQPNQLRLTLLRGSEFPDPDADKDWHEFSYALYPHSGTWKTAQTARKAVEFNLPLDLVKQEAIADSTTHSLPPDRQLLDLNSENLISIAFKQSEDSPDKWILRCYECHGEAAQLHFSSSLNLRLDQAVDLLEQPTSPITIQEQTATIPPWAIASFKLLGRKQGIG
jgi:alpha-mannosidase